MKNYLLTAMFVISMISVAIILSEITITGQVFMSSTCGELGCYNLCADGCSDGENCCTTPQGDFCFEEGSCEELKEALAKEPELEEPSPMGINWAIFFGTLGLIFAITYWMKKR